MLHYFATFDERYRVVNSQIKAVAQERIAEILKAGVEDRSFRQLDAGLIAKTMHNSLVGYLLSSVTEINKPSDLQLSRILEDSLLSLVLPIPADES